MQENHIFFHLQSILVFTINLMTYITILNKINN